MRSYMARRCHSCHGRRHLDRLLLRRRLHQRSSTPHPPQQHLAATIDGDEHDLIAAALSTGVERAFAAELHGLVHDQSASSSSDAAATPYHRVDVDDALEDADGGSRQRMDRC